jgi:hypothetical protein
MNPVTTMQHGEDRDGTYMVGMMRCIGRGACGGEHDERWMEGNEENRARDIGGSKYLQFDPMTQT